MSTERTPIKVLLRSEQSGGEIAVMDNIVGTSALLIAFALAVFKPWGRLRKGHANERDV